MGSLFIYIVYYAYIPALVIDCRFSNRDVSVIYLRSPVVGTFIYFFGNSKLWVKHNVPKLMNSPLSPPRNAPNSTVCTILDTGG